jgi:integrase
MPVRAKDLSIKALPVKAVRYEKAVQDHPGLVVCVWPSGEISYLLRYRQDGVLKRATLEAGTLAEARREWLDKANDVKRGDDPAEAVRNKRAAKQLGRQEARGAPTFAALAADYITLYAKRNKRSWRADELMLATAVLPHWGSIKAKQIKRRDVIDLLDRIAEKTPVRANRVLAVVRKLCNWAVERDVLEISPCVGVKPPSSETSRERVLTDAELKLFWSNLAECGLDELDQAALKMQLLTAARIGEVVGASWSEIDFAKGEWLIPGKRTKNGRESLIPLSYAALVAIEAAPRTSAFIFVRKSKTGHTRIDVITHNLHHALPALGIERFTSHDLRRTAATKLAELGTSRVVIDAILNHVDRSVGAIYDRHNYAAEKRAALDAWARRLEQIVTGTESTVTPIRRARLRSGQ